MKFTTMLLATCATVYLSLSLLQFDQLRLDLKDVEPDCASYWHYFNSPAVMAEAEVDIEEYAVYSALLRGIEVSLRDGHPVKVIVINDQTEDATPVKNIGVNDQTEVRWTCTSLPLATDFERAQKINLLFCQRVQPRYAFIPDMG